MTPRPESEATHLREKARRELLGLLEGVSKARPCQKAESECLRLALGPRKEEFGHQQVTNRTNWPLCPLFNPTGVWGGKGVRA